MAAFSATQMDIEIIILSGINQTEKDKYCVATYMWNVKSDRSELLYKTETDSQTEKTNLWSTTKPDKWGEGMDEFSSVQSLSRVRLFATP